MYHHHKALSKVELTGCQLIYSVMAKRFSASLQRTAVRALLYASLTAFASTALAQEGMFVLTGSMTNPRASHTATLLNNGMVLIAGGFNALNAGGTLQSTATTELYDPATGTFTATGSMIIARSGPSATLLNNGKVLVVGGSNNRSGDLASAELYDPATGTFTATGSMTTPRDGPTATPLSNGKVLVAGGEILVYLGVNNFLASAELYDPATGTFTATGSMTIARSGATATLLNNGNVLVAGGVDATNTPLASAELYEPIVIFPTSLSFLGQILGTTSASQTVTLTNNQSTALSITSIAVSGTNASDFTETDNCVGSVAAGATCTINVTFTPAALGSRAGTLNIANNTSGNPLTVPLIGTGVTATQIVGLSTSSLTFYESDGWVNQSSSEHHFEQHRQFNSDDFQPGFQRRECLGLCRNRQLRWLRGRRGKLLHKCDLFPYCHRSPDWNTEYYRQRDQPPKPPSSDADWHSHPVSPNCKPIFNECCFRESVSQHYERGANRDVTQYGSCCSYHSGDCSCRS